MSAREELESLRQMGYGSRSRQSTAYSITSLTPPRRESKPKPPMEVEHAWHASKELEDKRHAVNVLKDAVRARQATITKHRRLIAKNEVVLQRLVQELGKAQDIAKAQEALEREAA